MDTFLRLLRRLGDAGARYVVIGVWGANYYAESGSTLFSTLDRDLFLPPDAENLLLVWKTCSAVGLKLSSGDEPLGAPLDLVLAERVVERSALTKAKDAKGLEVDLTLEMAGYDFEEVWSNRRLFKVGDTEISVARLSQIVVSKAKANRPKDRLFLETHADALKRLMNRE